MASTVGEHARYYSYHCNACYWDIFVSVVQCWASTNVVFISEVYPAPANQEAEWVELYNQHLRSPRSPATSCTISS